MNSYSNTKYVLCQYITSSLLYKELAYLISHSPLPTTPVVDANMTPTGSVVLTNGLDLVNDANFHIHFLTPTANKAKFRMADVAATVLWKQ